MSYNLPSFEWAKSFIKRHQDRLRVRICQNIKRARAAVSAADVENIFQLYAKVLDGIPASNVYNYDETNLSDDPGQRKFIFKRGVKYSERVMDSTKTAISLMFCETADGVVLPAYVVYEADHLWNTWMEGGPKGTRYNRSSSG